MTDEYLLDLSFSGKVLNDREARLFESLEPFPYRVLIVIDSPRRFPAFQQTLEHFFFTAVKE